MTVNEFVNAQKWTFARTYAEKAPHEYIVRNNIVGTDEDFVNMVMMIREFGIRAKFWGHEYSYLLLEGRYYWTMGEPIDEVKILNRCEASSYELTMRFKGNGNNL